MTPRLLRRRPECRECQDLRERLAEWRAAYKRTVTEMDQMTKEHRDLATRLANEQAKGEAF